MTSWQYHLMNVSKFFANVRRFFHKSPVFQDVFSLNGENKKWLHRLDEFVFVKQKTLSVMMVL